MKNRFNFNVIGTIGLLIFAVSCESNKFEDQQMTHVANSMLLTQVLANQPCTPTATSPSFASLSTDFTPTCTGMNCHNSTDRAGQLDLTVYSQVVARVSKGNPTQSLLYQKITASLPLGSMKSEANKIPGFTQRVSDWIQGCALP
jgi:hypothetical protein